MHRSESQWQLRLATLAADTGLDEIANQCWNRALTLDPALTPLALEFLRERPGKKADEIIPENRFVCRIAITELLREEGSSELWGQSLGYLRKTPTILACDDWDAIFDQSQCYRLLGDVYHRLGQGEQAREAFLKSVELSPGDSELWINLVSWMMEFGDRSEARLEARKARNLFPRDTRFDELLRSMAASDIEEVRLRDEARLRDETPSRETEE